VDTRTKIIDANQAVKIAAGGATVVSGDFDPLLASVAERLSELKSEGKPLLVLIVSSKHSILPPRARAELVAGLACVNHVCHTPVDLIPSVRLEEEHRMGLARLILHVHARQQAAVKTPS